MGKNFVQCTKDGWMMERPCLKLRIEIEFGARNSINNWFLQEPHNITSQKMAFFIVTTLKTSDLRNFSTVITA
jgi:hypothetical protein